MNNKKRKRSGINGKGLSSTWTLAGILAVLLVVAAVVYFNVRADGAPREMESLKAAAPMDVQSSGADAKTKPAGPGGADLTEGTSGSSGAENGQGPAGPASEGQGGPESGSQSEAETESSPAYLENLSGINPGTILDAGQIDFDHLDRYFMSWKIEEGDTFYQRINGKSYHANDYVPLSSLRYLKMPHYNFDGQIQVGEMIVNKDIQEDVFSIFEELFQNKYQIQSMYLIDNYWTGDPDSTDSASIDANNTSAFCYRQVTGGGKLSNHAYGRAIDLNPQQNPYVSYSSGKPKWSHLNANDYIARDTGLPHVITHDDLAYKLFTRHGFRWGGDWTNPKDYQHFDKNKK